MDEGEETDEDSAEQFCFPFKSGRPPEPSSTQTSNEAPAESEAPAGNDTPTDDDKEPDDLRKDLRARTIAAARTPGNEDNLTLKVFIFSSSWCFNCLHDCFFLYECFMLFRYWIHYLVRRLIFQGRSSRQWIRQR